MATDGNDIGSVDETARRRFEQFWSAGTPHPIEEFLPERTQLNYLTTLEELVLIDMEFSWKAWSRQRSGAAEVVTPNDAGPPEVETYVNRFGIREQSEVVRRLLLEEIELRRRFGAQPPEIDEYRRRFPEIPLPDTVFAGAIDAQADTAVAPAVDGSAHVHETLPREFGPYRLLERIGAGGMGVVYRARQSNLERDVAVKVLRTEHLNALPPDSRQALIDRFRTESRSTARINHPYIVSVHDVGEIDGLPYYAMQFVVGSSLADLFKSQSPAPREAARTCRDVALAVQAAHDFGILHRDLKPHNIIVAADSRAPYVADFGLAKLLDEDASPTVTGEILGTPQYMPPEQAQDSGAVTIRSDVYALGAVLYFLLTGRPPFSGRTHLEILRQVADRDPVPPRQSNPQLDADLQVICLKCLQKEPQHRYPSAAALASDLSNWLDGRPIAARPPGRWERLSRWCLRNPMSSGLAAATAIALFVAVGALSVGYMKTSAANVRTKAALEKARASDHRTRATINDLFTIVSTEVLLDQPNMQLVRRDLLQRALVHYQEFLTTHQDDPELKSEIAETHRRIGQIVEELHSPAAAKPSYERASAIQTALHRERPDDEAIAREFGTTLNAYGACLTRLREFDGALAAFEDARDIRADLADRTDAQTEDGIEYRRLLANTEMNMGLVDKHRRQYQSARQRIQTSIERRIELLAPAPSALWKVIRDQGKAYFNLANLEIDDNQLNEARRHADRAIELFEQYVEERPEDMESRYHLVLCHRLKGEICAGLMEFAHAEIAFQTEFARMSDLATENPRVPKYQVEFARLLFMRGQRAFFEPDLQSAESLFVQCRERLVSVLNRGDATPDALSDLVQVRCAIADVHVLREQWADAFSEAQQALPLIQQLVSESPQEQRYAEQLQEVRALIDAATESLETKPESPGKL